MTDEPKKPNIWDGIEKQMRKELLGPSHLEPAEARAAARHENITCECIAQIEGDRLLKLGDEHGAEVAHRIAGLLRIRRDKFLEPF